MPTAEAKSKLRGHKRNGPRRSWKVGDYVFGRLIVAEKRSGKYANVRAVAECKNGHRAVLASLTDPSLATCGRCRQRAWNVGDVIGDRLIVDERNGDPVLRCKNGHVSKRHAKSMFEKCGKCRTWNIGDRVGNRVIVGSRPGTNGSAIPVAECPNGHRSGISGNRVGRCKQCIVDKPVLIAGFPIGERKLADALGVRLNTLRMHIALGATGRELLLPGMNAGSQRRLKRAWGARQTSRRRQSDVGDQTIVGGRLGVR